MAPKASKPTIKQISWTTDNSALIWSLINELEKRENFKTLYGTKKGENSSGDTKIKAYKRIGKTLFPDLFEINEETIASRVKGKAEDLTATYKAKVKLLQQTGGGLRDEDNIDQDASDDVNIYLKCYVPATGPDHTTSEEYKNLWDQILDGFPFFARLHYMHSSRPNTVPPAVTTGVGPEGRQVVHFKAPLLKPAHTITDDQIDPRLICSSQALLSPVPATTPFTPITNMASAPTVDKENVPQSSATRQGPKASSFKLAEMVETARANIKKIPAKRSFEEMMVDLTRQNLEAASERAAAANDQAHRRLLIDERKQLIKLHELGVYAKSELIRKLAALDGNWSTSSQLPKRARTRSQSPTWDIERGGELLSDDDT